MSDLQSRAIGRTEPVGNQPSQLGRSGTTTFLFALAVLLSAALLFAVQPLFTRMVLPYLGGTPATWNTCLVFFQVSLLGGYLYVHLLSTRLRTRAQLVVHAVLLVLALATLPISLPVDTADATSRPVTWLLLALATAVGLPFFALSATAPLLQRWFARHTGADPYFLYAASNAGSLIGLLSYPFVIEPNLTLNLQRQIWSASLFVVTALVVACGLVARRQLVSIRGNETRQDSGIHEQGLRPSWNDRVWWLVLSAVPSSLLLGVTLHISTDVAAVPLLWVVPLALYLLTFIAAFSPRLPVSRTWTLRVLPLVLFAAVFALILEPPWIWSLAIHLLAFTIVALVCHRELAARRPSADHLTTFYLWLSLGGATGGLFNALLAPVIFTQVIEYPLALVVIALIRPSPQWSRRRPEPLLPLLALPLVVFAVVAVSWVFGLMPGLAGASVVTGYWLLAAAMLAFSNRTAPFALAITAIIASHTMLPRQQGTRSLFAARSFFGVHRVTMDAPPSVHRLFHGTTLHGWQAIEARGRCDPTSYYHRVGPIGQVFERLGTRLDDVTVIGLGAGAVACYGHGGSTTTFIEIDPIVEQVARDSSLFTFLANAPGVTRVVLADGRVGLSSTPPASIDVLIVDAFSSDAIPTHLLTREFIEMAATRVRTDGLLAFHISNRHLDLGPVLAATAAAAGLSAAEQYHSPALADASASRWLVAGRPQGWLSLVMADPRWQPARPGPHIWTDDFSNVLDVLTWSDRRAIGSR